MCSKRRDPTPSSSFFLFRFVLLLSKRVSSDHLLYIRFSFTPLPFFYSNKAAPLKDRNDHHLSSFKTVKIHFQRPIQDDDDGRSARHKNTLGKNERKRSYTWKNDDDYVCPPCNA